MDIELLPEDRLGHLLGRSESMRRLMLQVRKVARTEAPSLIVGESGLPRACELALRGGYPDVAGQINQFKP